MSGSQKSYATILGKFSDGIAVLKTIPDYNPNKPEIKTGALDAFIENINTRNSACITTADVLKNLRNERMVSAFKTKYSDVNCLENLFRNILNYLKVDFGVDHPSTVLVVSIIKKINPPYEKKEKPADGTEPKKAKSESEKTYQALAGYGLEIYTSLFSLGETYNPQNNAISLTNFKARVDELAKLNSDIAVAEKNYSDAVSAREEAYNGDAGITSLIVSIKNYLASFEGGKNNAGYTAFSYAVK
jgi:hypothetical protein